MEGQELVEVEREMVPMSIQAVAEESRAIQLIQAKIITAKKFPRDVVRAKARILDECKSINLANKAQYKFPRGGTMVTGPTIRLTEVVARNYGNLDYGVRELERRHNVSVCQSYCWDLENNVTSDKVFEVPHEIQLKGGKKKRLTDPRDIYELCANNGARRLRACIIAVVPNTIMEDAEAACRQTLVKGGGEPIEKRLANMCTAFKELGVSVEMIEERMTHPITVTTAEEIVDLIAIHNSIRDKHAKRADFFNFPENAVDEEASLMAERIAAMSQSNVKSDGQVPMSKVESDIERGPHGQE